MSEIEYPRLEIAFFLVVFSENTVPPMRFLKLPQLNSSQDLS